MEPTKRVAAIHDLSGFGRASLTAIIPTLSTMEIQVCPLPTAILSSHTGGFDSFSYVDLTDTMEAYINEWKKLNLHFDCIYSGYLGSGQQIDIVSDFIAHFKKDDTLVVVDPVMGDDGKFYSTFNEDFIPLMRRLVTKADVITPNYTEAAFLLGYDHCPENISREEIKDWLVRLSDLGAEIVVVTSLPDKENPEYTNTVAYNRKDHSFWKIRCRYIPAHYPGTGDIFASVMIGGLLKGEGLPVAIDRSVQFISQCIKDSFCIDYPKRNGVMLEKNLGFLRTRPIISDYEEL